MNKRPGIAPIPIAIPIARRDDFFLGGIGGGTGVMIGCCAGGIGAPVDYSVVCVILLWLYQRVGDWLICDHGIVFWSIVEGNDQA